jgi:hypothetical protein
VKEMNTEQTEQQSLHISQEKLLAFVCTMIDGSGLVEDAISHKQNGLRRERGQDQLTTFISPQGVDAQLSINN